VTLTVQIDLKPAQYLLTISCDVSTTDGDSCKLDNSCYRCQWRVQMLTGWLST